MTAQLRFDVTGTPIPQGSKKAFVMGKRAVLVDDNAEKLKPWRATVAGVAELHMLGRERFEDAVVLSALFIMPRPKTVTRPWPSVKPDVDKLVRAIGDSLTTAQVWRDDSQVVHVDALAIYGPTPGVRVVVTAIAGNAVAEWLLRNEVKDARK